jgi:hypothetical protein
MADVPPKPRKTSGVRSCYSKNGAPKSAFATKKLAERAIPRTTKGLHAYPCPAHGWHLGHG